MLAVHLGLGNAALRGALGLGAARAATLQKLVLLAASYWFYASWSSELLALIVLSSAVDYTAGLRIGRTRERRTRRRWLWLSLGVNLGVLGFFKYFNFFVEEATAALAAAGLDVGYTRLDIVLPVGISFYTFQTMSYTIDIYRRQMRPTRSVLDFFLFVGFFPQLVAGPIVRAFEFLPQLGSRPKSPTRRDLIAGLDQFLIGLFKKVVIADVAGGLVDATYADVGAHSSAAVLCAAIAFCVQIYADFSGYSDMAIGAARMLGFRLPVNFRLPYLACSVTDYWRRWHISLSSWFRDYLYIPLGGNRHGPFVTYRNLITTFLLTGLWHGANWTFVMFGAWNGAMLIVERVGRRFATLPRQLLLVGFAWTTASTIVSFIFFRAEDLEHATAIFARIGALDSEGGPFAWRRFAFVFSLIVLYHAGAALRLRERVVSPQWGVFWRAFGYALLVCLLVAVQPEVPGARPFIYFQF